MSRKTRLQAARGRAHVAEGGQLGGGCRCVLGCVVREDGDAVEGAVVFWVV